MPIVIDFVHNTYLAVVEQETMLQLQQHTRPPPNDAKGSQELPDIVTTTSVNDTYALLPRSANDTNISRAVKSQHLHISGKLRIVSYFDLSGFDYQCG